MNQRTILTATWLAAAIEQLSGFALRRAEAIQNEVGFGFRSSPTAPATFADLRRERRACQCSGLPLRVSNRHNDSAILAPEINVAYRFWHDCTHIRLNENFTRMGEVLVGQEQLRQLEADGHVAGSLPWRLLFAETVGQTECVHRIGRFPIDQRRFTIEYLELGLPTAIRNEAERQHRKAIGVIAKSPLATVVASETAEVVPFPQSSWGYQLGGDAA